MKKNPETLLSLSLTLPPSGGGEGGGERAGGLPACGEALHQRGGRFACNDTLPILFSLLLLCYFLIGCQRPLYRETEMIMGTFIEVSSDDPRAAGIVFPEFRRIDKMMSNFDEKSELSGINANGEARVSLDLFDIIKRSKEFYRESEGAFDVTVGPLVSLWKKAISAKTLPREAEVKNLLGLVGSDKISLDEATRTVKLLGPGMGIDLGGIAKGYAVDKAVAKLKEAGVRSAIVNAGGDLYCLGRNYRALWRVGIRDPRRAGRLIKKLALENMAAATSGDYEQFFIVDHKRYSHIIDPRTGYPADSTIIAATITAPDCLTAVVLAKVFIILGKDKGEKIMRQYPGLKAILIDNQDKIYNIIS